MSRVPHNPPFSMFGATGDTIEEAVKKTYDLNTSPSSPDRIKNMTDWRSYVINDLVLDKGSKYPTIAQTDTPTGTKGVNPTTSDMMRSYPAPTNIISGIESTFSTDAFDYDLQSEDLLVAPNPLYPSGYDLSRPSGASNNVGIAYKCQINFKLNYKVPFPIYFKILGEWSYNKDAGTGDIRMSQDNDNPLIVSIPQGFNEFTHDITVVVPRSALGHDLPVGTTASGSVALSVHVDNTIGYAYNKDSTLKSGSTQVYSIGYFDFNDSPIVDGGGGNNQTKIRTIAKRYTLAKTDSNVNCQFINNFFQYGLQQTTGSDNIYNGANNSNVNGAVATKFTDNELSIIDYNDTGDYQFDTGSGITPTLGQRTIVNSALIGLDNGAFIEYVEANTPPTPANIKKILITDGSCGGI